MVPSLHDQYLVKDIFIISFDNILRGVALHSFNNEMLVGCFLGQRRSFKLGRGGGGGAGLRTHCLLVLGKL